MWGIFWLLVGGGFLANALITRLKGDDILGGSGVGSLLLGALLAALGLSILGVV